MRLVAPFLVASLVLPFPALSATIHVPADQPTIQAGINAAADGDTVLIAPGTYTGAGNKNLNPMGRAILLASEQGPESTIIDCELSGRSIYFVSGETVSTVVDGFTLSNGSVSGSYPNSWGGAILCAGSSPSIRNCTVIGNNAFGSSGRGGGIALLDASPAISNCSIRQNRAESGQGGGVHCQAGSSPVLVDCVIAQNIAADGGGMTAVVNSSPSLDGSLFSANAANRGGAIYCEQVSLSLASSMITQNSAGWGGGVFFSTSGAALEGAVFTENTASNGGAAVYIAANASVQISGCTFDGNGYAAVSCDHLSAPIIEDCLFMNTTGVGALSSGGVPTFRRCVFSAGADFAVYSTGSTSNPTIESCTIYQNAGGIFLSQGAATIENTIIAFSKSEAVSCIFGGIPVVSCSDLYLNLGGDWSGCVAGQGGSNGNFSANPRFCDPFNGDFTLNSLSPCAPGNSPAGCGLIGALPVACGVTDVLDSPSAAATRLTVMPNPVRGSARFEFGNPPPFVILDIFDSQGRLVEQLSKQDGHWEWSPGAVIPAGIYFARPGEVAGGAEAVKFLYLR